MHSKRVPYYLYRFFAVCLGLFLLYECGRNIMRGEFSSGGRHSGAAKTVEAEESPFQFLLGATFMGGLGLTFLIGGVVGWESKKR